MPARLRAPQLRVMVISTATSLQFMRLPRGASSSRVTRAGVGLALWYIHAVARSCWDHLFIEVDEPLLGGASCSCAARMWSLYVLERTALAYPSARTLHGGALTSMPKTRRARCAREVASELPTREFPFASLARPPRFSRFAHDASSEPPVPRSHRRCQRRLNLRRNRSVRRTALRHRSVPLRLHVWHRRRPRRLRHAAKLDDDGGVEPTHNSSRPTTSSHR